MGADTNLFTVCFNLRLELQIEVRIGNVICPILVVYNEIQRCQLVVVEGAMVTKRNL